MSHFININFYLFLFVTLIQEVFSECCLDVKERGIYPVSPGDVGMVFFVNIKNTCNEKFQISTKMIHCSESICNTEEETSAMYLIGGYMGSINAKGTITVTLIYPNMYLHNREGFCTIGIYFTDKSHATHVMRAVIKFNTIPKDKIIPNEVKALYKKSEANIHCETKDLDPLDKCLPVDCMMKYLGARNYFNKKWKRCQKVPACVSDDANEEPDVSYIPTSNRCRNLNNCVTENDIRILEDGVVTKITDSSFHSNRGLIMKCNHGHLDNSTSLCKCNPGFMSIETDTEDYLPGLSVYHMCNVKVNSWNQTNFPKIRTTILAFAILALVITMVILLLTFCCYGVHLYLTSYERESPFNRSSYEDMEDIEVQCTGAGHYDTPSCGCR